MKENEIRPKKLFERYLELSKKDAQAFETGHFQEIDCPGCGNRSSEFKFEKDGFNYNICRECGSLYCSPRPCREVLKKFYENSQSSKYWSTVFSPAVAEIRREKLFRKKAIQIYRLLENERYVPKNICDVGAGYGVLLEELQELLPEILYFAIEPNPEFADKCRSKGFDTLETIVEETSEWSNRFDLVISQEVLEHVYSTESFIKSLYKVTKDGGYCLVTGLGYEGFDILTLQKDSNSIFPPHHINFLSIKGFEALFERVGFKNVQVWTPGELDVDIVANSPYCDEFITTLVKRGSDALNDFKSFLQKYKLSSHIGVYARK